MHVFWQLNGRHKHGSLNRRKIISCLWSSFAVLKQKKIADVLTYSRVPKSTKGGLLKILAAWLSLATYQVPDLDQTCSLLQISPSYT